MQIGGKRPAALALTNGEDDTNTVYKYLRTDEDRPSVSVRNNRGNVSGSQFNPPESPLTTAMKASNILVDENPSQTYFIKSDGGNFQKNQFHLKKMKLFFNLIEPRNIFQKIL